MALTPVQLQALKTDILATQILSEQPMSSDGHAFIRDYYNALESPAFFVWATSVPSDDVYDQIVWANFTPSPAPDNTATWTNRSLACQGKQFNVQTMLMARSTVNGSKAKFRNGLQDALTDIPSGNNGNFRQAGWTDVQIALTRQASRGEKLFANTSQGNGAANTTPATMVFEGTLEISDIETARNLP